ncbi:hypothetical protein [Providencia sp. PROV044]|nr:hypothetical protein [Providencia sp. PROV044]
MKWYLQGDGNTQEILCEDTIAKILPDLASVSNLLSKMQMS